MLYTMSSRGPYRDSWRTPYNFQTQFFHPNYTFPIFPNSVPYSFFPAPGTFYSPNIFNRPYLEPTENRPLIPFETRSSTHIFLSSPYPYSMQVPSITNTNISNPFMDQGFGSSDISSRHLLQNPSTNFNIVSGSSQSLASFTTDTTFRSTYESTAVTPVQNRKRKRDSSAEDAWSSVAPVSIPTREEESSGDGAIDLSINSTIKRPRVDTCFGTCDSSVTLKASDNNDRDSKRRVCAPKTGESDFLALDIPNSSYTSTVTVGNSAQERQNVRTDLIPVKNESSEKAPVPTSTQTRCTSPETYRGSEISDRGELDITPVYGTAWPLSIPKTNANNLPNIVNIPFSPCFSSVLHTPSVGMNWWTNTPVNNFPSVTASNSSSFDFSNPLGIKREEVASTVVSSSSALDVSVAGRGAEDLVCPPQVDNTSSETSESETKPEAQSPIDNTQTEKRDTPVTIKLEDISITRPAEDPKLEGSSKPKIMRNWLLENLEKGLKQESVLHNKKMKPFDVRGLKLLSRGIEKIERHSGEGRLTGLGLLCALAEERMRDDMGAPDEDSWENNSVSSELSEADQTGIEVDSEPNEDEKAGEITQELEEFYSPQTRVLHFEAKDSEESDSGPPLLIKADDIPVWSSEEQNRPPTLSPNAEPDSQELSNVRDLVSPDRSIRNDSCNDQEEEEVNEQVIAEVSGAIDAGKTLKIKKEIGKMGRKKSTERGRSQKSLLTRSISCTRAGESEAPKSHEQRAENIFPIKKDTESSWVSRDRDGAEQDDSSLEHHWTTKESEPSCSGQNANESSTKDNKTHGKLILRLRRERLKKDEEEENPRSNSCVLTTERLMISKFPVKILTVDTGLFYTGQLSAIRPPDVYGITIDGERGNRPHIYSREEVLNNSFFEVIPTSKKDLPPGARVCAYWSEQCKCLYPGCVSASAIVDPDPNSVNIEFDDGDSCRISINNIRLLPENYPIAECNPKESSKPGKRKKRINTREDEGCQSHENVPGSSETSVMKEPPKENVVPETSTSKSNESEINLPEKKNKSHNRSTNRGKHKKKHKHRHHHHHKKHSQSVTESRPLGRKKKAKKSSTKRKSKRSVPLPAPKPWVWHGKGFRRPGNKGKARKEYYRGIQRGNERIMIGECAVFVSSGRPDRPFIGRIESMWETWGANMVVRVKWFYHPEETVGCPATLEYPGALFESPHSDENDVQTISHKCEVLPLKSYLEKLGNSAKNHDGNTKLYYLAGFYDPTSTTLQFQEGVK